MKQSEKKPPRLKVFQERFDLLRKEHGSNNTDFAKFLDMSRQTVGFYLNGDRVPDALNLIRIAEKCSVSADWLLGLSDFRSKEEYHNASEVCSCFLSLMANEFNEHDRKRVANSVTEIIKGFKYALCEYMIGYTHYESAVVMLSSVFVSSASCIQVAVDSSSYVDSQEDADKLFRRIDHILEESSVSAYKELGIYFHSIRNLTMKLLEAHDYRCTTYNFAFDADELLEENERKYMNFLENEADQHADTRGK